MLVLTVGDPLPSKPMFGQASISDLLQVQLPAFPGGSASLFCPLGVKGLPGLYLVLSDQAINVPVHKLANLWVWRPEVKAGCL